ncbi:heavy metal translocating P-type ATPase [Pseudoxanthomonas mexicana]|uniref:heavy metal translocating P-type ATPase n=1 Tax=Pseudoxanthomonas mexicana TaxID=128785 RepID=UPI00398AD915
MDASGGQCDCYHCGGPLPATPVRAQAGDGWRAYCCSGCAAAAAWIADARLDSYYALRSAAAARVGEEPLDLSIWDREEVLAEHGREIPGGREIVVLTDGMRCAACAWLIDRALEREPAVIDSTANAVTGRIRIAWDPRRAPLSDPLRTLATLGYRPYLAGGRAHEQARLADRKRWLLRLGIAGLGAMQAMMMAEALYLDFDSTMPAATRDFFRWLTFLLSTPVVFYAGWPFLSGAWRELRQRHVGMDTLIAGSTLLAYFASVLETIRGGPHVWYDAAVMFVFLLLAARMLEQRARGIATAQVDALARARPAFATRERDGGVETVPVSALAVGDTVRVAIGDGVPADGVLLDDCADMEEALLTGESHPVRKQAGDPLYAGTLCRERPARMRITGTGGATRLAQLARLVEQAQAHRPALARMADRIGSRFAAALLLSSLAVYGFWHWHDPSRALEVTLAWLVISCPCALSLSVPAALATAHGALARLGVLSTRAEALDTLARATDVVFDKTGTLTGARLQLRQVETFDGFDRERALRIAAALEHDSRHPIAAAFAGIAVDAPAQAVQTVSGQGIKGMVDGTRWRLGRGAYAGGPIDGDGVWLGDGARAVARFELAEQLRPHAAEALSALRAQGLSVHLCSGDAETPVRRLAAQLGIDGAQARQSPEDKLAYVRGLQAQGRVVAMVGDGLNDAPVLAGADVSLAMGQGAPLAQRAADLVMTGETLARIPQALALSRRTRAIIRQNLAWAAGYNLLALPLAAAGWVTPWLAALGMAASSLAVTLNALRLARRVPEPEACA